MTLDELKEKLSTAKNLIYSGEIEKAINDAEKIEKEYWNSIYSSIVYYNLGILYMNIGFWYNKLGFNDKTLEAYKIAESKFDNSNNKEESLKYIECIVTIANIYTSEGNYDWADFYKNKYTDTFTRSKVNIEYQYMLYLSEDFFSGYKKMLEDNFDEALDLISKYNQELRNFIENNPQIVDINLYYNYFYSLACEAYINAYKGDIERALNLYELTVLDYNLTDEDILYIILLNTIFYADLLSELKFNAKSIKYYNKAIDLIKKLSGSDLHKQSKYSCYLAECYSKKGMVLLPDDLENNEKKESFIKVVNYYLTQAIDIFEDFCFQTTDYYKYKHIECLLQKANLLIFTISLKKDPNYKEAIKMLKTAKNLLSN
ncbi:MAG: hypothetical protein KA792_04215, partial [Bacteroidales bacterium]|nr:hypothetical protein [Bacteroidales bacterium]